MNNRIVWPLSLASALSLLAALPAVGQTAVPYPAVGAKWQTPLGYVPATTATLVSASNTVLLGGVWLNNTSGGAVTVTISEAGGTLCGGSPCPIWSAVSIPANSIAAFTFGGLQATGVTWSASSGSAVVGWMWGNYTTSTIAHVGEIENALAILGAMP